MVLIMAASRAHHRSQVVLRLNLGFKMSKLSHLVVVPRGLLCEASREASCEQNNMKNKIDGRGGE